MLLSLSRRELDVRGRSAAESLARRVNDWGLVTRQARLHGLLPLIHRSLASLEPGSVPPVTLEQASSYARGVAWRNLAMTHELLRVLRLLDARGIGVLNLKGPALAALVYGDLALREFNDLDLLVRRGDLMGARQMLEQEGYVVRTSMGPGQAAAQMDFEYHIPLYRQESQTALELHWGISKKSYAYPQLTDWWWAERHTLRLAGEDVHTLSPEAQLLFLCLHGSKHGWRSLGWVCDVAELVRFSSSVDLDRVTRQAAASGVQRMLALGLLLASRLFEAPVPAARIPLFDHPQTLALASEAEVRLGTNVYELASMADELSYQARLRERLGDRVRFFIRAATTPNVSDLELVALPPRLKGLYYLVKPVRLMAKWALGWRTNPRT